MTVLLTVLAIISKNRIKKYRQILCKGRHIMALTELQIKNIKPTDKQQKLSDSGGMYLLIKTNGGKYWRMDYRFNDKRKTLSIGTYPTVTLAQARIKREKAKALIANGKDPSEHVTKKAKKAVIVQAQEVQQIAEDRLFENVAIEWHTKHAPNWKKSHSDKIIGRLRADVFPWIGKRPMNEISPPELLAVIRRIEARGALETAHRVLANCGQIWRYGVATGRAERNQAADLRGALPPVQGTHFAAITEPVGIGELLRKIEHYKGGLITRTALAFAPLVFVRPTELRHAEWCEIDLDAAMWTIPAAKMKMKREHLVPLSSQAIAILKDIQPLTGSGKYVFCGAYDNDKPMSDGTINKALRTMGYDTKTQMTGHGFRSIASTLLNEQGYNRDAIEMQLAHSENDSVRAAYNRAQYLPERKAMMQAWSDYLYALKQGADIVTFRRA
jgi:integrase